MSTSRITPPSADKIQEALENLNCSDAVLINSSIVCGTHTTIPGFLSSLGPHGWNGKTVHFFGCLLSAVMKCNSYSDEMLREAHKHIKMFNSKII